MRRISLLVAVAVLVAGLSVAPRYLVSRSATSPDFVHFESGHVHPACITPGGTRLLVVNTADNRLSVFDLTAGAPGILTRIAEIPVGLEPVSVAARTNNEAWVVNRLSDDVSVVNLYTLQVMATIHVGDEPADVVFAGSHAYVSVSEYDQVRVYDTTTRVLQKTVAIDGRWPRAMAKSADGTKVYVALLHGGNRTSVLSAAEAGDSLPAPNPPKDPGLPTAPKVGLIVQLQSGDWRDESNKLWNAKAKYTMTDVQLAEIETAGSTVSRTFGGLGAVQLGVAVNPVDARIALTGTEARNFTRFEPNLRGHIVDTRLSLITAGGAVTTANLNPQINYSVTPGPQSEADSAIGIPSGLAWSVDGQRLYATSLASNRLAVLNPAAPGSPLARVATVAGPTGVVVDDARGQLYVIGRFHNEVQTLSCATLATLAVGSIGMDPTPDAIVNGRKFFYGGFTSGHGDQACATCHLFGDFDNLAWDLGNPQGTMQPINRTGQVDPLILASVHPMKGPMVTQSLRGLPSTGMLHWRADRQDLSAFNPAFVSLMGRGAVLPDSEMIAFADFVLPLTYPPNPNEFLDRTMAGDAGPSSVPSARRGEQFFFNIQVDGNLKCDDCHNAFLFAPGTNGQIIDRIALQESQDFKVPQLRNLYVKTGFKDSVGAVNKRGFGFTHDGATDNLFDFLHFPGFNFGSDPNAANATRRDLERFLLSFDTGMAPSVGFQITFDGTNNTDATLNAQLDTLQSEVGSSNCQLIAKGRVGGQPRGWLYASGGTWKSDKQAEGNATRAMLLATAGPGSELTITGVPPGTGTRMALDRDRDGYEDGDELDAHSDPGNPLSTPLNVGVPPGTRPVEGLRRVGPNPFRASVEVEFALGRGGPVDLTVFDVLGREVRRVARGAMLTAGVQHLTWDGRDAHGAHAGAGVYFVRLRTSAGSWTRPVVKVE
jgi:YVTN family beta-propeller protein